MVPWFLVVPLTCAGHPTMTLITDQITPPAVHETLGSQPPESATLRFDVTRMLYGGDRPELATTVSTNMQGEQGHARHSKMVKDGRIAN